ncbi:MAG: SRPBCC domain-containing protein [Candidatus Palauibacterales bacterium]|nr:SRPBCC domain-containing protein [Candidatus Palauibacterales bacterium]MDP2530929.1 SRPBCC domain-containing protein [Candidatus Palauibacterales bacterium]MDP2584959.1 SRPBCC domain-containing protein [Candidatus Palauibacterales bacterium]
MKTLAHAVTIALPLLLAVRAAPAAAQVPPNGFVVRHETRIDAALARVYDALVAEIGEWWNPEHTFSGDARNLSLDDRPGGCLCEELAGGGGVEHLRVVYVDPPRVLRLSGALGPLQGSALVGTLTWTLAEADGGTRLELTYAVGGFLEGGFEGVAPAVKSVLAGQMSRLKRYVETGKPEAPSSPGSPDRTRSGR